MKKPLTLLFIVIIALLATSCPLETEKLVNLKISLDFLDDGSRGLGVENDSHYSYVYYKAYPANNKIALKGLTIEWKNVPLDSNSNIIDLGFYSTGSWIIELDFRDKDNISVYTDSLENDLNNDTELKVTIP